MTSLLDIADASPGSATIRGVEVPVVGLTATDIADLLAKFEGLQELMDGKPFTVANLIRSVPEAIGTIGAIGTGKPGDAAVEAKMKKLSFADQIKLLTAIMYETFGEHTDPLLAGLRGYAASLSDREDRGKEPASTLRPPSRDSLRSATTPEMFGATHHGNSPATPS